eukprot:TRINITY_DN3220_c0_g2_i2.p3 TRINITY_DN3220_c0_g2~~TRINITY_DN3220_c0_g2_i2.p3  ORF type:complete len:194 (-),score=-11.67 TRINITY_DN3220_c0_g2_i2:1050-1631(-)
MYSLRVIVESDFVKVTQVFGHHLIVQFVFIFQNSLFQYIQQFKFFWSAGPESRELNISTLDNCVVFIAILFQLFLLRYFSFFIIKIDFLFLFLSATIVQLFLATSYRWLVFNPYCFFVVTFSRMHQLYVTQNFLLQGVFSFLEVFFFTLIQVKEECIRVYYFEKYFFQIFQHFMIVKQQQEKASCPKNNIIQS